MITRTALLPAKFINILIICLIKKPSLKRSLAKCSKALSSVKDYVKNNLCNDLFSEYFKGGLFQKYS